METRYIEVYQDGELIAKEPYEVSDEQLQDEQEQRDIAAIKDKLEQPWTASEAQAILKKLINRLIKKGILP